MKAKSAPNPRAISINESNPPLAPLDQRREQMLSIPCSQSQAYVCGARGSITRLTRHRQIGGLFLATRTVIARALADDDGADRCGAFDTRFTLAIIKSPFAGEAAGLCL